MAEQSGELRRTLGKRGVCRREDCITCSETIKESEGSFDIHRCKSEVRDDSDLLPAPEILRTSGEQRWKRAKFTVEATNLPRFSCRFIDRPTVKEEETVDSDPNERPRERVSGVFFWGGTGTDLYFHFEPHPPTDN